jgi:hypothetical protein
VNVLHLRKGLNQRSWRTLVPLVVAIAGWQCAPSSKNVDRKTPMKDHITVRAMVLQYTPNAMEDSFDSGDFSSYDASKLRILSPEDMAGKELEIFHDEEVAEDSPWRAIDRRIAFEIARADLSADMTLFSGAVTGLRLDEK